MSRYEYQAVCPEGHRDYVVTYGVIVDNDTVRLSDCPKCGRPRLGRPLPEPSP